jgi:hypothetical protein
VLHTLIEKLAADKRISAEEAVEVRRAVFPDGVISRPEAEMLFTLNERVSGDDQAWTDAFVEAICDHLLLGDAPEGHVTEEGAAWLESRIGRDAVLERETELELLLKLLEKAESTPPRLQELARLYVSRAVLEGKGYTGRDPALVPGQIGETELAMIRRALFAVGGAGDVAVTRAEAEWLFDLDAATEGRAHAPGWRDLFVSGVMNHLFAAGPSALLRRDDMMQRARWLNAEHKSGVGSFLGRVFDGGYDRFGEKVRQENPVEAMEAHNLEREAQAHVAAALDTDEAAWLVTRIRADRRKTVNEQALLDAVKGVHGEALKSA